MSKRSVWIVSMLLGSGCMGDAPDGEGDPEGPAGVLGGFGSGEVGGSGDDGNGEDEGGTPGEDGSGGGTDGGPDGPEEEAGEPDESTGTGADDGDAPCVESCVELPAGWDGPVRVHSGVVAGVCDGSFPDEADLLHRDLSADAASCICSCSPPSNVHCEQAEMRASSSFSCANPTGSTGPDGLCLPFPPGGVDAGDTLVFEEDGVWGGACLASAAHHVPEATWGTEVRLCGGGELAGACPGVSQTCVATPNAGALCVYRGGEFDCSDAGEFSVASGVAFSGFEDTRACSACTCSAPQGQCHLSSIRLYDGGGCPGFGLVEQVGVNGPVACFDADAPATHYRIDGLDPGPGVACTPSPMVVDGALTATDPVTVCCRP
ncbi:MAG: hypothetical protein AAF721_20125 [Myxococcota bacterium]